MVNLELSTSAGGAVAGKVSRAARGIPRVSDTVHIVAEAEKAAGVDGRLAAAVRVFAAETFGQPSCCYWQMSRCTVIRSCRR
jgi:hypothetical protein